MFSFAWLKYKSHFFILFSIIYIERSPKRSRLARKNAHWQIVNTSFVAIGNGHSASTTTATGKHEHAVWASSTSASFRLPHWIPVFHQSNNPNTPRYRNKRAKHLGQIERRTAKADSILLRPFDQIEQQQAYSNSLAQMARLVHVRQQG